MLVLMRMREICSYDVIVPETVLIPASPSELSHHLLSQRLHYSLTFGYNERTSILITEIIFMYLINEMTSDRLSSWGEAGGPSLVFCIARGV